ncbi:sphingosine kinase 2-like [Haematobia irritans]|uniref:sphingosine kinase 2-like n=1 Tax=Haematobia irritans TaxID=7368 RepID=UPI003F4FECF6
MLNTSEGGGYRVHMIPGTIKTVEDEALRKKGGKEKNDKYYGLRAFANMQELQDILIMLIFKMPIIYSFLSVGWGLISDIDIESERLRPLGYRRFTIWTLHRLIKLRTYKGRISYLLKNECSPYENVPPKSVSKNVSVERSLSCNFIPSNLTKSYNNGGHIRDTDFEDVISLETVANPSFRSRCGSWLSSGSRRSTYYSIAESVYHSISDSEYNPLNDEVETNENDNMEYICLSKKRAMPLPSDEWVVEDGEFVMIHAAYQSHLSSDCHFAPQSMLNDGTIHLVIIYGGISRSQLLTFLINMSSGTHLPSENTDYIRVVRVEAFHLEPHENNGIITVDGERVKCAPLRARIIPKSVNIMIPNNMQ